MASRISTLTRQHLGTATSLTVLAIAAKAILGRVGTFDLGFDDECLMLHRGLMLGEWPLISADFSPLYTVWYGLLAALEPDPVVLYTVNWLVLQLAVATLLYVLSRRSGAPRLAAGLVTIAWSLSRAVAIWPFVVCFSTAILALGALAATTTRDRLVALACVSIATLLATFARPELALPGLPLAAGAIVWSVARAIRARRVRALAPGLAVAAALALGLAVFGSPLAGGRSYMAFGQHYAYNRVEAEGLRVDPWSTWQSFTDADFPGARSIAGAALTNPAAFARHLGYNARLLPDRLAWFVEIDGWVPLPLKIAIALGAGVVLILGAMTLASRWRRVSPRLHAWLPLWLPVLGSFAAAMLVIRPRDHYFVPFVFLSCATLAGACGALASPQREERPGRFARALRLAEPVALAIGVLVLVLLPTYRPGALPSLLVPRGAPPPSQWDGRNTVQALRALGLHGERVVLAAEYSHAVYAGLPFRQVWPSDDDGAFVGLLAAHDVDLVIATPRLRSNPRFGDDPGFRSFLEDEGDHRGFVLTHVAGSTTVIAVRER